MPRSVGSAPGIPQPPDTEAWRYFGDGFAGRIVAARLQGYDSGSLAYVDVAVDGSGVLQTSGGGGGGSVTQGTSPWVVSGTVTTGGLTDTQLRASAVPVSLAALPALAAGTAVIGHVIVDTAPTTAVTQSTSPWVTNDPGLPDTLGQKTMANSTGVVLASDQTSIPVAATLAAETTKVIGTVNQGTSPWADDVTDRAARLLGVVSGTVAASNTGFNVTGSDGITTQAATVQQINGRYLLFVRDPEVNKTLTEILFQLRSNNT